MKYAFVSFILFLVNTIGACNGYVNNDISGWNYVDNIANHNLSGFIQKGNWDQCFEMRVPPNILKLQCHSSEGISEVNSLFCVHLSDGFMCT